MIAAHKGRRAEHRARALLEGKYDESATQFREYLRLAPDTPANRRNITRATGFIRQFEDPNAPPVETMKPRPR